MSGLADEADEIMMCCAGCGIAGVDDIKLKECTACKSVRYCSVKVSGSIDRNTNDSVKSGPLNYVMKCYSNNLKAAI